MGTNVAMLRGVNIGSHNRIKMPALEALFAGLGHTGVVTFIQSGNVVFKSRSKSAAALTRGIEERIARDLGLDVAVLLRTSDELDRVVQQNPFAGTRADPAKLHVTFLAHEPDGTLVHALEGFDAGKDELRVAGREVYLHCPGGYGTTKLNNGFLERRLKTIATTRNWNTVNALSELASA